MQVGRSGSRTASATSVPSRRALREASRGPRRTAPLARWSPRVAVLAGLAAATIGFPLVSQASSAGGPEILAETALAPDGPSAYEVLASTAQEVTPTTLLAPIAGVVRVADPAPSRSLERTPLPGCDGVARPASSNGLIPTSDLCELWDGTNMLRGDAAVALSELNETYRATFARDLCITDSYRTLGEQRRLYATKPGLAASPGRSNHGWGLAIDLCGSETRNSSAMTWLRENGPVYGWDNPHWARRGGSGAYEPWHWEYVPGTTELGTNY